MKLYLTFLMVLVLAFLLFMHSIDGLRTEKVLKEGTVWQEVHIVWDWNKLTAWGQERRPFQKLEREQEERTSDKTGTETGKR